MGEWTKGPLVVSDGALDRSEGDGAPRWEVHVPHAETTAYCAKEANARLYAAAPDLYDALEALSQNVGAASLVRNQFGIELRAQAAAALSKARGEGAL